MSKFDHITLVIETLPDARAQVQVNIPTPMPGMRLETAAHALAIDALGWLGKQPAVAGFVYSPDWPTRPLTVIGNGGTELRLASEFPPMTPELASILGLMCFQCISFAQALRAGGHQIASRAEDEQAAVLHWMLGHYFRHGKDWRTFAVQDVERMKAAAIANQAKEGGTA